MKSARILKQCAIGVSILIVYGMLLSTLQRLFTGEHGGDPGWLGFFLMPLALLASNYPLILGALGIWIAAEILSVLSRIEKNLEEGKENVKNSLTGT